MLVCGDETQKPFPLLVWNLASRKLLYDLRIPHHDFVTSLAAITHEGHYVCCVAKVNVHIYSVLLFRLNKIPNIGSHDLISTSFEEAQYFLEGLML